jgi:hypothetical protein
MTYFADGDDELRSADNEGDRITTAWKLEGFQGRSWRMVAYDSSDVPSQSLRHLLDEPGPLKSLSRLEAYTR